MKLKLTNNAESLLAGAISATDTTVLLAPGTGTLFPNLGAGEFFPLTLVKSVGGQPVREIVYVTARASDSCTVLRGQEGTVAVAFGSGDYAGCHLTAGCLAGKADLSGAAFLGNVNLNGNELIGAALIGCAPALNNNLSANVIDISAGPVQKWAPNTGAQTLTIQGWPPAGTHGELLIYGTNLGAATITIAGNPVKFLNSDGTFTSSSNLNTNHGATLQASGLDFVMFWSPDGGTTRYAKVFR